MEKSLGLHGMFAFKIKITSNIDGCDFPRLFSGM